MIEHVEEPVRLRVMVVDDDVDAATSLSEMLQLLGCKTAFAFGGHTALRIAQLFKPNVVFLDLDMPGADGCRVLSDIRAVDERPTSAIYVCLTGSTDARTRCLEAGFHRFVSKPISAAELDEILVEGRSRIALGAPSSVGHRDMRQSA